MTQKMNKFTYILIAITVIVGNAGMLVLSTARLNRWRLDRADSLYSQSISETNARKQTILLIQSDFLAPSDEKKLQIADIYLKGGDFISAKAYMSRIRNEQGYLKYAESALETGEIDIAREYIAKLSDNAKKHELQLFMNISANEQNIGQIEEISTAPETNLGSLLRAINTGVYDNISTDSVIGSGIVNIVREGEGEFTTELKIAELLIRCNQPILSRIILNTIIEKKTNITDAYVLKALSYNNQGNYADALRIQLLSVNTDPANLLLYQKALEYAKLAGDQAEATWLTDNITYLEAIQSKAYCTKCGI
jgi:tetratricopeptide (TPR) repeat protein